MRKCLIILILTAGAAVLAMGQSRGSSIHFENPSLDVGTVAQGETITRVFKFSNKGPGTLEILDVAHS